MHESCPRGFDQALLSGHLDGELTQAADQRVRLHLEECPACRALFDQIRSVKETAMSTQFNEPREEQWTERPAGPVSAATRFTGWFLAIVWALALSGYALWQVATGPEGLAVKLLVFGGLTGVVLLGISILMDRLGEARSDRYREVKK
jgi:predicted anti-sigma-YlaC factor YlaD